MEQLTIEQLYKMLGELQYYIEVNEASLKQLYQQKEAVLQQITSYQQQPPQNDQSPF